MFRCWFFIFCTIGRFGSLKYMTEAGVVNINVRDSNTGYTALMISSFMGYTEDVSILLAAGTAY